MKDDGFDVTPDTDRPMTVSQMAEAFDRMATGRKPLFQLGDFTLSSGKKSPWKIECDSLTDDDVECLAFLLKQRLPPFATVEGIPRGGLRLAAAPEKYATPGGCILLVDDVLTTGGSLEKARRRHIDSLPPGSLVEPGWVWGGVLFSRGECPPWVTPLFKMCD